MDAYLLDWAGLLVRWVHVIVAIAWIGSSFYFVFLDNSLEKPTDPALKEKGVDGELWAVHGGGFYNPQKYLVAPKTLPEHLHWFYWESYSTWISGFALFSLLYLFNARTYLIDPNVFAWSSPGMAIGAALAFLAAGWLVYDGICRVAGRNPDGSIGGDMRVGVLITVFLIFAAWLACHLFAGRAAYLLVGAMMATVMSANVFFWIIPGQREVVADLRAGRKPNPLHGQRAKQRSVHNTYFTLPVLVAMISNHYSMTYSSKWNWLILVVVMLAGAFARQVFVLRHKAKPFMVPALASVALVLVAGAIAMPQRSAATQQAAAEPVTFTRVQAIVQERCVACHNVGFANKNVRLDTPETLVSNAQLAYQQAVQQRTMPMNNATQMTDEERAILGRWVETGAKTN